MTARNNNLQVFDPSTGEIIPWDAIRTFYPSYDFSANHPDFPAGHLSPTQLSDIYNQEANPPEGSPSSGNSVQNVPASQAEYEKYVADEMEKRIFRQPPCFEKLGPFPVPLVPSFDKTSAAAADAEESKEEPVGMSVFLSSRWWYGPAMLTRCLYYFSSRQGGKTMGYACQRLGEVAVTEGPVGRRLYPDERVIVFLTDNDL